MGKNKQQGTAWETGFRQRALSYGLDTERIAEAGSNDEGDVRIKGRFEGEQPIVALAWKRRVPKKGNKRRVPDGQPEVVVITLDDFLDLMWKSEYNAIVECKATERLNVTRALAKAIEKVKRNG